MCPLFLLFERGLLTSVNYYRSYCISISSKVVHYTILYFQSNKSKQPSQDFFELLSLFPQPEFYLLLHFYLLELG